MYALLKPLLFQLEPETAHELAMDALAFCSRHPGALRLLSLLAERPEPRLAVRRFGLTFPNPVGLAAGMDKHARALPAWAALGFGSVEVGSVTAQAQAGNPKPRLFRLAKDSALINRMGFNSDGADRVAARLELLARRELRPQVPIGVNLGKSRGTPLERAHEDYLYSLAKLWPHGDYFVLNVSSPNTAGLRELQLGARLEPLLRAVQAFVRQQAAPKPLLLKIAPDLTWAELDALAGLTRSYGLAGLIATNTTLERHRLSSAVDEAGGLSGKPLRKRALQVLRHLHKRVGDELPIISVGGIFSANDVVERLEAGASLVQLYTSLIYEGPLLVKRLTQGLLDRLDALGLSSAEELIGSNVAPHPAMS